MHQKSLKPKKGKRFVRIDHRTIIEVSDNQHHNKTHAKTHEVGSTDTINHNSLANLKRYSFTSTAIIFLALYALDTLTPISPIGPHPVITTSFPSIGK